MNTIDKARRIADLAIAKNAVDPVLLQVTELCSYTDIIAICHGRSTRQVQAIVQHVATEMKHEGVANYGIEGDGDALWVLVDFGDVVLHVFHEPMRAYYNLEGIYPDAERVEVADKAAGSDN